jgi:RNA-directed DNA polymerase
MIAEQEKSQTIVLEVRGAVENQSAQIESQQSTQAHEQMRALTQNLMERICEPSNLNEAVKRVRSNKGSPGIDGMSVYSLEGWLDINGQQLRRSLLEGQYRPQPVRAVEIPKPDGGVRELGIPTVIDRVVQQAILQVLSPLLDPTFSESSFGFRPRRSAHQALRAACEHVKAGYVYVVDLDIEKFFDRVNHDILMSRLAKRIDDKRLLRLIRWYLQAGMFKNGIALDREEGTPQGGPLSPLLANLLLDEFDKELEKRGHRFCRYADDCNIYVRSEQAGKRVMASLTEFLSKRLRLKVNQQKSAVAYAEERQFLGHRLLRGGKLGVAPKAIRKFKSRVREITSRHRGVKMERIIAELNLFTRGWLNYFRHAKITQLLRLLDGWIRRRLRCYRLVQCKRRYIVVRLLLKLGAEKSEAWNAVRSRPGPWRLSQKDVTRNALSCEWFTSLGLFSLSSKYAAFKA